MVTFNADACDKCRRRNLVTFSVEPEEARRTVVLNRWRKPCPSCFDIEAEKAGVRTTITDVEAVSWSDRPAPMARSRRGR
jgi:hypothetical protein